MNTRHVTDQLPLWVGGDLADAEVQVVEAHLFQCASCRVAAESLRESRQWLQEGAESPYSAEELAAFRTGVMARIRAEAASRRPRKTGRTSRLWLLAAATLLLTAGAFRLVRHPSAGERPGASSPALVASAMEPTPPAPPRLAVARQRPLPAKATPREGPAFSRLELQTSDPQIRIIWLARATPVPALPETTLP